MQRWQKRGREISWLRMAKGRSDQELVEYQKGSPLDTSCVLLWGVIGEYKSVIAGGWRRGSGRSRME